MTLDGARVTFHPAGHVLGSAQIAVEANGLRIVASGDYKDVADPTCAPFELVRCDVFITEATFGLPVFRHGDPDGEIAKLLHSVALFPERAHLVGAYSLGKAQRVIALIRKAGYDKPIYLHGALESITRYYESRGIALGELRSVRGARQGRARRRHRALPAIGAQGAVVAPLPRSGHLRSRRAGCGCARGRASAASSCRWSSPTMPTGTASPRPSRRPAPREIWVTHGQEDALVHWSVTPRARGAAARHRRLWRRGRDRRHHCGSGRGRRGPR